MGRSRGGLTTKIHALVDANGLPVALKLTEGQAHDGRSAADMLQGLGAGEILIADRAYDSDLLRQNMTARGVFANIKPLARRLDKPAFSPFLYRSRNRVERFFNKLKHFRAVATRYEKHAANYLALVKLAATRIWMRAYESVSQSRNSEAPELGPPPRPGLKPCIQPLWRAHPCARRGNVKTPSQPFFYPGSSLRAHGNDAYQNLFTPSQGSSLRVQGQGSIF